MNKLLQFQVSTKIVLLIFFAIWLSSLALYSKAIHFDFVDFDDKTVLLAHPNLYNENSFVLSLQEILYNYFPREEPLILRDITWALDSYLFGFKNPMGYHLGNVILNSFNISLLFIFLFLTTKKLIFSLLISITFGVLPVHVEPVCWVMGRKDLLVTFFMLMALISQTMFMESRAEKKRILYLAALLFNIMALVSKISALPFFMVLAGHQVFYPYLKGRLPLNAPLDIKKVIKKILPQYIPHVIVSIYIYYWYNGIISAYGVLGRGPGPLTTEHIQNLFLFIPFVMLKYLKLILIPFNDYSIFYYKPNVNLPLEAFYLPVSILFVLSIIILSVIAFRQRKDIFSYLFTFTILSLPYCNIVYIGIWIANRYVYFSSFCILAMAFTLLAPLFNKGIMTRALMGILFSIFLFGSLFETLKNQDAWAENHALWLHENAMEDPSILSYEALAKSFVKKAKKENNEAVREDMLSQAEWIIQKGIKKYNDLGFLKSEYFIPEITVHAKLYYLMGQIAAIRGDKIENQLQFYQKAYTIYKTRLNIVMMSDAYYRLAMHTEEVEEKRKFAKMALFYLEEIIIIEKDPRFLQRYFMTLDYNYLKNFSFLDSKIVQLKAYISNKLNGNRGS